ncbi:MAG: tetratricopeptide repeat protein [Spirochaetes bacterium]|nr:tetratricopeptide repeat protein [Spirochaetota bacterium]
MKESEAAFESKGGKDGKGGKAEGSGALSLNREKLLTAYERNKDIYHNITGDLVVRIEKIFSDFNLNPIVKGRVKSFPSYYSKLKKYMTMNKSKAIVPPINDLMGIRVVFPFRGDVRKAKKIIEKKFSVDEIRQKGHTPYLNNHDTFKEFGYESMHLLIRIPNDILEERGSPESGEIAEIQIRTIMQDAWAELEHELFYKKKNTPLFDKMQRKLAAVSANFFLADSIFDEVRRHQRKLVKQLGKRRETFFQKIEESTDGLLFEYEPNEKPKAAPQEKLPAPVSIDDSSMDTLLLSALTLHNKGSYNDAVAVYGKILDFNPTDAICKIIYKHRGMAHFACSQYELAIEDFTNALKKGEEDYQSAYYRGVVNSVLKNYAQAIDDYTLSLAIYPYQSFCIFRRGQAYYHIGDYPQALADCEASLAMDSQNESAQKFKSLLQDKIKL